MLHKRFRIRELPVHPILAQELLIRLMEAGVRQTRFGKFFALLYDNVPPVSVFSHFQEEGPKPAMSHLSQTRIARNRQNRFRW